MKSERVRLVGTDSVRFMLYSAVVWGIGVIRRTDGGSFLGGGLRKGRFRFVLDVNVNVVVFFFGGGDGTEG